MLRTILTVLLPLITPLAVYIIWNLLVRKFAPAKADEEAVEPEGWRRWPWLWLVLGGCGMSAASLLLLGVVTGDNITGRYIPPHMQDGQLVPGQFAPADGSDATK